MVWEAETTVIRLIAVVLVFGLLHGRSGRSGRWIAFNMLTVIACAVAHFMRGGAGDLASALGGAAMAAALTVPLALRGMTGRHVTAASIAAGSVLGPTGAAAAFGITVVLHLLGRLAGRGGFLFPDRFVLGIPDIETPAGGSLLTMIERGRFGRGPVSDTESARMSSTATAASGAIPLRVTLALATLAVLMTEAFI